MRPKDLPPEMAGLWKVQYEPRDNIIRKLCKDKRYAKFCKKYKKQNFTMKILYIDELQRRGFFK